jgi:hypothetical protein
VEVTQVNLGTNTVVTSARLSIAGIPGADGGGGSSKEIRHEWNSPYDYIATAPEGTSESSTTWTITRIEVFADGTTSTTTATDSWNNRVTAVYS